MGSIRVNKQSATLFFDFRYQGVRCREYTSLGDSAGNRKKLQRILDRIEREIENGKFTS